jgi:hypothetical protein
LDLLKVRSFSFFLPFSISRTYFLPLADQSDVRSPFHTFHCPPILTLLSHSPEQLAAVSQLFLTRLAVPHLDIAQTFSAYSSFITKYDNDNYGEALPAANKIYAPAVKKTDERFAEEAKLVRSPCSPCSFFHANQYSRR